MNKSEHPCLASGPDGGPCPHYGNGYKKEPCASCPLPAQYDDALKQEFFPSMSFLRHSRKNNWEIQKMEKENSKTVKQESSEEKNVLNTLEELEQKFSQQSDLYGKPEDLKSEKGKFIDDHIKEMCQNAGMTIEQLRANAKDIHNKQVRQLFQETRDRIIESLASGKFGKLNQTQIGKYLGVSCHAISIRMGKMGISPMYPTGSQGNRKKSTKKKAPKTKTPAPIKPPEIKETFKPGQMTLWLDFVEHPEIYDDLSALAREELRSIENQALWIFKQIHARGLDVKEL